MAVENFFNTDNQGDASGAVDLFGGGGALAPGSNGGSNASDITNWGLSNIDRNVNPNVTTNYLTQDDIYSDKTIIEPINTQPIDYYYGQNIPVTQQGFSGVGFSAPTIAATGNLMPYSVMDKQLAAMEQRKAARRKMAEWSPDIVGIIDPYKNKNFQDAQIKSYRNIWDDAVSRFGGDKSSAGYWLKNTAEGKMAIKAEAVKWNTAKAIYDNVYSTAANIMATVQSTGTKQKLDAEDGGSSTISSTDLTKVYYPPEVKALAYEYVNSMNNAMGTGDDTDLKKSNEVGMRLIGAIGTTKLAAEITKNIKDEVIDVDVKNRLQAAGGTGSLIKIAEEVTNGWLYKDGKKDKGFSDEFSRFVAGKYNEAYGHYDELGLRKPDFNDFQKTVEYNIKRGTKDKDWQNTYDLYAKHLREKQKIEQVVIRPLQQETVNFKTEGGKTYQLKLSNVVKFNKNQETEVNSPNTYTMGSDMIPVAQEKSQNIKITGYGRYDYVDKNGTPQSEWVAIGYVPSKVSQVQRDADGSVNLSLSAGTIQYVPLRGVQSQVSSTLQKNNILIDEANPIQGEESYETPYANQNLPGTGIDVKEGKAAGTESVPTYQKTIVKQAKNSEGKTWYLYSDGTTEIK